MWVVQSTGANGDVGLDRGGTLLHVPDSHIWEMKLGG